MVDQHDGFVSAPPDHSPAYAAPQAVPLDGIQPPVIRMLGKVGNLLDVRPEKILHAALRLCISYTWNRYIAIEQFLDAHAQLIKVNVMVFHTLTALYFLHTGQVRQVGPPVPL